MLVQAAGTWPGLSIVCCFLVSAYFFLAILSLLALAEIFEGEDERDLAIEKKQEAEQMIAECIGIENAPAVNQLYQMYATESSPNTNGIGNY